MKRVFGRVEAVFDLLYLTAALLIGLALLLTGAAGSPRALAGLMALVLALGDACHLLPRVRVILTGREESLRRALGRGKQVASITMTVFYLLLWQIGLALFAPAGRGVLSILAYALAAARILLCLLPQNRWTERYPPVRWGVLRNVPFFGLGVLVTGFYFTHRTAAPGLEWMWLAVALSFAFYLPVVLWANRNPKIGMLMLPKTGAYLWMLAMCLSL